tara:strand:- start:170 stop:1375 length:1206 start_codon:yes stop_codon:yes gene_type:complete
MTQNDFIIDNGTGSAVRVDIQNAFQSLASNNSGNSAPSVKYPFQFFADTTSPAKLKIRDGANGEYIDLIRFDSPVKKILELELGNAGVPSLSFTTDINTGIFSGGADEFNICTNGTERFVLNGSGNCGIMNTSPESFGASVNTLVVGSTTGNNGITIAAGSTNFSSLLFADDSTVGGLISYGHNDNKFNFATNNSNTSNVVIDSNGRVGIGEISPNASSLIHVKSSNPEIRIQGTNGNGATHKIFSSGTNADSLQITGTSNLLLNADTLHFRSTDTNTEYMRLTNGNLGINTTGPTQKLHVVGNILASGTITPGSDIELKKDIEPLTDVLSKVKQLVGINFTFKSNNEKSMGLIAQEVEKVYPELVKGDDGNKSLNYMGLTGALIEAIKELATKVEALESA